jgi:hypothetical protein
VINNFEKVRGAFFKGVGGGGGGGGTGAVGAEPREGAAGTCGGVGGVEMGFGCGATVGVDIGKTRRGTGADNSGDSP